MIITMFVTLCHMGSVAPGLPPVELCEEQPVATRDVEATTRRDKLEAINACFAAIQPEIAPRIKPGFTFQSGRCIEGNEKPRGSI
jgi:hypothetical protein